YQAYGKPVIILYDQAAAGNPYYFTARELDAETGLYYYRARYYDWHRGAFTQEDPIGLKGGHNLYVYAYNHPVNYIDPSGEFVQAVILGGVMGGILGGASTAIGDYAANGATSMSGIGKGIAVGVVVGAILPIVTMEIALSGATMAGSSALAQYTGAAVVGGLGNIAQYSWSTDDFSLGNMIKAGGVGLVAGGIGGSFKGILGMQNVPWQVLAQKNASSYGLRALGTGITGSYITNEATSCQKGEN
ncbi:MAG: RHS repeat-associated core domain-containing protein, partial [Elusimicrobia bacterium]